LGRGGGRGRALSQRAPRTSLALSPPSSREGGKAEASDEDARSPRASDEDAARAGGDRSLGARARPFSAARGATNLIRLWTTCGLRRGGGYGAGRGDSAREEKERKGAVREGKKKRKSRKRAVNSSLGHARGARSAPRAPQSDGSTAQKRGVAQSARRDALLATPRHGFWRAGVAKEERRRGSPPALALSPPIEGRWRRPPTRRARGRAGDGSPRAWTWPVVRRVGCRGGWRTGEERGGGQREGGLSGSLSLSSSFTQKSPACARARHARPRARRRCAERAEAHRLRGKTHLLQVASGAARGGGARSFSLCVSGSACLVCALSRAVSLSRCLALCLSVYLARGGCVVRSGDSKRGWFVCGVFVGLLRKVGRGGGRFLRRESGDLATFAAPDARTPRHT